MDAAALAHKVHDLVAQELRLAPASGQRLPSPEDIRKILRGDNPSPRLARASSLRFDDA